MSSPLLFPPAVTGERIEIWRDAGWKEESVWDFHKISGRHFHISLVSLSQKSPSLRSGRFHRRFGVIFGSTLSLIGTVILPVIVDY